MVRVGLNFQGVQSVFLGGIKNRMEMWMWEVHGNFYGSPSSDSSSKYNFWIPRHL